MQTLNQLKIGNTVYDLAAKYDSEGSNIKDTYFKKEEMQERHFLFYLGYCSYSEEPNYCLSESMRASRCSTATSCGIFFSTQTCLR